MKNKIWMSSPHMGENEFKYVKDAFDTNWIAPAGPYLPKFETSICDYTKSKHSLAVTSGTAAIHLALRLLEVQQDDIVLCQSLTFIGSAVPILYEKATPVFIDSESNTWNMCPEALETAIKKCSKKPKAIIVVHLYGMPSKMEEIMSISQKYDIPIIEDAAEALGSSINGKQCGTFGEFGVYSFNGNKIITTGGGGALVSKDKEAIDQARFLSTQAKENTPHYEHITFGYNYRLSNISAAIGCGQLEVLNDRIAKKRNLFTHYKSSTNIKLQKEPKGYISNRWLICGLLDDEKQRDNLIDELAKYNIESRPVWKPMHLQPLFKGTSYYGSNISEDIFDRGICLPSDTKMVDKDIEKINEILTNFFL